jgi:hypothetical protein
MADLLKTWPAAMEPRKVLTIFSERECFAEYYFTLGRGKPKQEIENLWFTYRGRILGHFRVDRIVCNTGDNIPKLRRIDGGESEWQIKRDRWVAICDPPFFRLKGHVWHDSFRGYRYFDLEAYRQTSESKIAL